MRPFLANCPNHQDPSIAPLRAVFRLSFRPLSLRQPNHRNSHSKRDTIRIGWDRDGETPRSADARGASRAVPAACSRNSGRCDRRSARPASIDDLSGTRPQSEGRWHYLPETAQRFAWARRLRGSQLERRSQLGELVRDRLAMGWSPEQIAGRLRRQAAQHEISHEFIYRWIYGPVGGRERAGLQCSSVVTAESAMSFPVSAPAPQRLVAGALRWRPRAARAAALGPVRAGDWRRTACRLPAG